MRILLFLLAAVLVWKNQASAQQRTLLAIFAHPDDEQSVSPVLAQYARAGVRVYVAVATDGRYGTNDDFGVDDPDSLSAIRHEEIRCMASQLGIEPPIWIGLPDQLRMQDGMDTLSVLLNFLKNRVRGLFDQLKPDAVITWGASGLTGHSDHRLVGNVVTEVFEEKSRGKPARLYYTELLRGSMPVGDSTLSTVDPRFLTVRIPVSHSAVEKARKAWGCYHSQYTATGFAYWQNLFWTTQGGTAYFRPFTTVPGIQHTLFP